MEKVEVDVGSNKLIIETGELAKQADGSVVVRYGDTVVLATAVSEKKAKEGLDFFPLTIDYVEKAFSAGKIPGGFLKREGRLSEREILTSRLTDRPIRPLFPKDYTFETQGVVSVLSYGEENISDVLGITAMSAALTVSDIPFNGPVGGVRVGRINGEFVINPNMEESGLSDLNFIVAGTESAVVMVEGGAQEIPEDIVLAAIDFAHENIKIIVKAQKELAGICGKTKRSCPLKEIDEDLYKSVREGYIERLKTAIVIPDKIRRQDAINEIIRDAVEKFQTEEDRSKKIAEYLHDMEQELVRGMIINEGIRADGRKPEDIRRISCQVAFLPRTHGSAIFTRGETQSLVAVTLGTREDEQKIDSLDGESYKTFMLHYNFPPFSVREVKPLRSPGRREIGHGALAERALLPVIPAKEEFPYTVRIVSDILESNGSSSMATVCGATLSLMDAGVPIKAPVAGIAMGLIQEGDKAVVLSDILGLEDHLGDMDFKVTGTEKGITAFQMDVKIEGISRNIMERAVNQARDGRLFILQKIKETLAEPRANLASNAPRIYTMHINPEKIRDIIGTGGKVIRGIVDETGTKIDITDDGVVNIASNDEESAKKAIDIISGIIEDAEVGKIYLGKVKKVVDFGAFVEILPGTEGLLHISQISDRRINKVTDEVNEGDEVMVKVIDIDRAGRIKLSRKEAMGEKVR